MIWLLAVVAKVNKADVDGETALMYASSNGHLDVVSLGCPAVSIYLKPNICLSDFLAILCLGCPLVFIDSRENMLLWMGFGSRNVYFIIRLVLR